MMDNNNLNEDVEEEVRTAQSRLFLRGVLFSLEKTLKQTQEQIELVNKYLGKH